MRDGFIDVIQSESRPRNANVRRQDAERCNISEVSIKAGDRGRTGDVQLGKLAFYR